MNAVSHLAGASHRVVEEKQQKSPKKSCRLVFGVEKKTPNTPPRPSVFLFEWHFLPVSVNKHKPWIEATYHGIITENDDKVLLDPPLIALDKDAPLRYAGEEGRLVQFTSLRVVPVRRKQCYL